MRSPSLTIALPVRVRVGAVAAGAVAGLGAAAAAARRVRVVCGLIRIVRRLIGVVAERVEVSSRAQV